MSHILQFLCQDSSPQLKKMHELLDQPDILLNTDLSEFDLDSLDFLEFIMLIESFCNVTLHEQVIFKATTLAELDQIIDAAKA